MPGQILFHDTRITHRFRTRFHFSMNAVLMTGGYMQRLEQKLVCMSIITVRVSWRNTSFIDPKETDRIPVDLILIFIHPKSEHLLCRPSSRQSEIERQAVIFPVHIPDKLSGHCPEGLFIIFKILYDHNHPFLSLTTLARAILRCHPQLGLFDRAVFTGGVEEQVLRTLLLPMMEDRVDQPPACLQSVATGIQSRIAQHGIEQQAFIGIGQIVLRKRS